MEYLILMLFFVSLSYMFFPGRRDDRHELPLKRRKRRMKGKGNSHSGAHQTDESHKGRHSMRSKKSAQTRKDERNINNIWVGDIIEISHLDQDFLVEEHFQVKESSWEWDEYTLVDGDDQYSLSVAEQGKEVYLSHSIDDLQLSYPPPETITFNDENYQLTASGRAESREKDEKESHRFRYFTFDGPDEFTLTLEDWEGELEYFLGEKLHPRDIEILPGSSE